MSSRDLSLPSTQPALRTYRLLPWRRYAATGLCAERFCTNRFALDHGPRVRHKDTTIAPTAVGYPATILASNDLTTARMSIFVPGRLQLRIGWYRVDARRGRFPVLRGHLGRAQRRDAYRIRQHRSESAVIQRFAPVSPDFAPRMPPSLNRRLICSKMNHSRMAYDAACPNIVDTTAAIKAKACDT